TTDLIVIHFRGRFHSFYRTDCIKARGHRISRASHGNSSQISKRLDLTLGVLDGQHVILPRLWIYPVARRNHLVTCESGNDITDTLLLVQPKLARPRAIDIELECWVVDVLWDVDVGNARDTLDLRCESGSSLMRPLRIRARNLNINGCWQPKVEYCI